MPLLIIIRVFFVILSVVERLNLITKEVLLMIIITDMVNYYSCVLCDFVYCGTTELDNKGGITDDNYY